MAYPSFFPSTNDRPDLALGDLPTVAPAACPGRAPTPSSDRLSGPTARWGRRPGSGSAPSMGPAADGTPEDLKPTVIPLRVDFRCAPNDLRNHLSPIHTTTIPHLPADD